MKKFIFLAIIILVIAPIFSLALVNTASAQADRGYECTTNRGDTGCIEGYSCTANPCFGRAGKKISDGNIECYASSATCEQAPGAVEVKWDPDCRKVCCDSVWGCPGSETIKEASGLTEEDPRVIVADVINVILGFLGIVAVILILAGGFMWMTAAGNEDKVATSKKLMIAGVVGLVIVLASFGIANFVVNALLEATR